ncbi:MAG: DUF123 domain-containing protein [Promethearchaeota archaeon]
MKIETNIVIGALGNIFFKKGEYFYIGSAMGRSGSSSLINRVKRHVSNSSIKKMRWHIDYFLQNKNTKITRIYLIPCKQKIECLVAQEIKNISKDYIKDFGSSDCNCCSHLYLVNES